MEIETTMRYHFTLLTMDIIKKPKNNKCWRRCGEKGTLLHWVPLSGKEENSNLKDPCTPVFIATLFIIAKAREKPMSISR